jgi:hypothetical protein
VSDVELPANGWLPRWHQTPLWNYLHDGGKRAVAIWHRRAGKDEVPASRRLVGDDARGQLRTLLA